MPQTKRDQFQDWVSKHVEDAVLALAAAHPNSRQVLHEELHSLQCYIRVRLTEKYNALEALDIIGSKRRRHPLEPSKKAG